MDIPQAFWLLLGYLLFLAFAVYLFTVGRRAISNAKGHFVKQLDYENQAQATAGNVTTIALCIGCVFLILWGIWKGFRQQAVKP